MVIALLCNKIRLDMNKRAGVRMKRRRQKSLMRGRKKVLGCLGIAVVGKKTHLQMNK